jgi:hypothetical protein
MIEDKKVTTAEGLGGGNIRWKHAVEERVVAGKALK